MIPFDQVKAELADAQENPVYTIPITHREAIAVWNALDDWARHTGDSLQFMRRLERRVQEEGRTTG